MILYDEALVSSGRHGYRDVNPHCPAHVIIGGVLHAPEALPLYTWLRPSYGFVPHMQLFLTQFTTVRISYSALNANLLAAFQSILPAIPIGLSGNISFSIEIIYVRGSQGLWAFARFGSWYLSTTTRHLLCTYFCDIFLPAWVPFHPRRTGSRVGARPAVKLRRPPSSRMARLMSPVSTSELQPPPRPPFDSLLSAAIHARARQKIR